jgi:uncharacterized HAD superfamily protein
MLVKPTLYCDIDSTINDHWKRIKRNTSEGICNWSKAFSEEEVMKDKPLEGAHKALEKLSKVYKIVFLTARGFENATKITKAWLYENNFVYYKLIVVERSIDKLKYVVEKDCLFIDDLSKKHEHEPPYKVLYTDTITALNENNVNYVLFKGSWKEVLNTLGIE